MQEGLGNPATKSDVKFVQLGGDDPSETKACCSWKPLCQLMFGIMLFASLSWVGFTIAAQRHGRHRQGGGENDGAAKRSWRLWETGPLQCRTLPLSSRFDCHPGPDPDASACESRGCCWNPAEGSDPDLVHFGVPACYYPAGYQSHKATNVSEHDFGVSVWYERLVESGYPGDVDRFRMDIAHKREGLVAVKIYAEPGGAPSSRSPHSPERLTDATTPQESSDIRIQLAETGFGFRIVRKSSGQSLFDCIGVGGFVFSEQFLQISTLLPSNYVYGLGLASPFLKSTQWTSYPMWNADSPPEHSHSNTYGSHPFYLSLDQQGRAHGVSFLNSHAMEVILQPAPAATFRAIGGNFDIHVAVGEEPLRVVEQYASLVGKPFMVPYWTLGYHQCRYGYRNLTETRRVLQRTVDAGIPIDAQWNDIDYMDDFKDFTYDKTNFAGLPRFVEELHQRNLRYVQIVDPGISASEAKGTYPPYDRGLQMDVFVRNSSDLPFVGKVWNPVSTVWPDFTHPRALEYWHGNLREYHEEVPIDGVWIDMNEPSNFYDGQSDGCAKSGPDALLDDPPYVPRGIAGGTLYSKTVCPSARHHRGRHYEHHNTYGLSETWATAQAMRSIRKKRAFVLSRSTYPGQGRYGAHWTGDISSTWEDMRFSISTILNFNLFGIPMVGADICGFNGDASAELCGRWMQLGAFYPFARNHNSLRQVDQDPAALGPEVVRSAKNALGVRYSLLPFLYSQMAKAHANGTPPVRSMMMNFPADETTYDLDAQFMWGDALLVLPVLEEDAVSVTGYFPDGAWYDYHDALLDPVVGPRFVAVDAPADTIPLFVREGSVLPTQRNASNTFESRKNPFLLRVYLTSACRSSGYCLLRAKGDMVYDDGESLHAFQNFTSIAFESLHDPETGSGHLKSTLLSGQHPLPPLTSVSVHGIGSVVKSVRLNGKPVQFFQSNKTKMVGAVKLSWNLLQPFRLDWAASS